MAIVLTVDVTPGSAADVTADALANIAMTLRVTVRAEFNGTAMLARPGMLGKHVLEEYEANR